MSFDLKHRWAAQIFKKLLGIKTDSKHGFDEHIKTVCKTASNKVRTL